MTIDKGQLNQARQWAADVDADRQTLSQDTIDAAADVIQSLPEAIVDGDKVREVINAQIDSHPHGTVGHHVAEELACNLQALLPAPGLASAVIAQAEQIKRLQAEMEEFDTAPVVSTEEERKILNELGYFDAEDMEEK